MAAPLDPDRPVGAPTPDRSDADALDADALDRAVQDAFADCVGTPGAVVGVRSPVGTWRAAYGVARPSTGEAMATANHLRIGSVTKVATATVVLQLAAEGLLALEDPIGRFVDGVPGGEDLPLDLLARMRSGVADYTTDVELVTRIAADPTVAVAPAEAIAAACRTSPVFAPGARFAYSNTNYLLLAAAAEVATGRPIGELLRDRVLDPLGLHATRWPGDDPALPLPYAEGFTLATAAAPDQPVDATAWNPAWAGAAGALISTVDDLLVLGEAAATGAGLLDEGWQARRLAAFGPATGMGDGVEYGFGLMAIDGWIGHSGDIPGYRAAVYHRPERSITVAVLTNSDIVAGRCPPAVPALPGEGVCTSPSSRLLDALTAVLGAPTSSPHLG